MSSTRSSRCSSSGWPETKADRWHMLRTQHRTPVSSKAVPGRVPPSTNHHIAHIPMRTFSMIVPLMTKGACSTYAIDSSMNTPPDTRVISPNRADRTVC